MRLNFRQKYVLLIGVMLVAAVLRLGWIASIPRGLWLDEAFILHWGEKIAHGETWPIFIIGNGGGSEPLLVYLAGLTIAILGPVKWAGRLVTLWSSLLSIAVVIRAGRTLKPHSGLDLIAGVSLTCLFWDMTLSHFGCQPALATLAAAATMTAFWHGARTGRWPAYALAGLALGLGLNAYIAFRLFVFVPLGAALLLWFTRRTERGPLLRGGLVMLGAALLISAPLGWFFINQPEWFLYRYQQTTGATLQSTQALAALLKNGLKTVAGLFWVGDSGWRQNLAGRPALDVVQIVFFSAGLITLLRRWRSAESWTLLLWLVVGLAPSALTEEAPHFGRTTMAIPAVVIIMAQGGLALTQVSRRVWPRLLIGAALFFSAGLTVYDYYVRWATSPELNMVFSVDQEKIGLALRAAPAGAYLYATPLRVNSYDVYWTLEYALGRAGTARLRLFNGHQCLVAPAYTDQPAVYAVIEPDDLDTSAFLQTAFSGVTRQPQATLTQGNRLEIYRVPAGQAPRLPVTAPLTATFGDLIETPGYSLAATTLRPGAPLVVTGIWQIRRTTPAALKVFVHLLGAPQPDGNVVYSQHDSQPCANRYPTYEWRAGEWVIDRYQLDVPADLPAGTYTLQIGWYDEATGRLPVVNPALPGPPDALVLRQFQVRAP